jgi:hypothetical protein
MQQPAQQPKVHDASLCMWEHRRHENNVGGACRNDYAMFTRRPSVVHMTRTLHIWSAVVIDAETSEGHFWHISVPICSL